MHVHKNGGATTIKLIKSHGVVLGLNPSQQVSGFQYVIVYLHLDI